MKQLRPYQDAALRALWNWLYTEGTGHPLVVAPVAAGKSLMIAEFIRQCHEQWPRTRIVLLTHVKELLQQNAEELKGQYPNCDYGFYCAGLGQKRLHNDVTYASIQSVNGKLDAFNRVPEIIIVDEVHLVSHKDSTQYRAFFDAVLQVNPNCKIIGFTGTPFRSDTGRLDEGEGALFDGVAYEIGMDYMINEGYWAKPVTPALAFKMDVAGVQTRGGDYVAGQLEARINTAHINDACVRELIEKGAGRKKWLVFTATVKHCEDVTEAIRSAGVSVAHITANTPPEERNANIERFRRGEIKCLVNVAVLTTGFNVPDVDLLCFMRPTRSPVLYIQTTGRGVRPIYAEGYDLSTREGRLAAIAAGPKPDCLVLDFGGVIDELGPIDQVSIKKKYTGEKEQSEKVLPVTKLCPNGHVSMAGQRYCYECSYQFFELNASASQKAVVSADEPPEWDQVIGWAMSKHAKRDDPTAPPSMRVAYATMSRSYSDYICFEHHKFKGEKKYYAYERARAWYAKHAQTACPELVPETIDEALLMKYKMPSHIFVKREGKYWRVLDTKYEKQESKNIAQEDFDIAW